VIAILESVINWHPSGKNDDRLNPHSAGATVNLGEKLGANPAPGSVILLKGDLGAGKTT
jgi:predicted ATP-dependent serine protease